MLVLICGIPNAGKTTYSSRYKNVIHTDDVVPSGRGHHQTVRDMVANEDDVCVEGTFIIARHRKKLAEAYNGNRKVCIWLDTPLDECIKREDRGRGTLITRNCSALFEPPTLDEGWDEIIIIRGDYEQSSSNER